MSQTDVAIPESVPAEVHARRGHSGHNQLPARLHERTEIRYNRSGHSAGSNRLDQVSH